MIVNTDLDKKGDQFPSKIISCNKEVDTLYFTTKNGVILQLTVLRDSVLRFRYATETNFEEDFSYAIDKNASRGYSHLSTEEDDEFYILKTSKLICHIKKSDLRIVIYDAIDNTIINEEELGFHWEENFEKGGNIVKMSKIAQHGESFYGLGDKPVHSNLRGKRFENWATDSYAFGRTTDPIYKTIPFYIGLHHKKAYGIFFDNSFRSFFDFCHERRHVTSFWAQGGEMNYYFIYGPKMGDVVSSYSDLTGTPELPPLWALGYHQSKWSYFPESDVTKLADKFRKLKIPCDALYLDIDYMDGFRCFTWNEEYFPDPKKMVKKLTDNGFKTVAIIDPGIKIDNNYKVYQEGIKNDYFCKRADGPLMHGKVWPGECYFPDFTNPEVRKWWSGLFKELIGEIGIKGVWNDMNEPAVMEVPNKTFPDDVRHDYDGNPCSHRKAHNIYGMQMAKATYEGLKKYAYPKRPFVITRSAFSGTQRYTSTWTGDNVASWEHLWIANIQAQRMGLSGFSFAGSDIGGFSEQPTGELYTRWIQLGVFHPFFRTHSSGDHGDQEPWAFDDEVLGIVKKFIEIRYQLLPYLYTAFRKYVNEGVSILKPLVLFDQDDKQTHNRTDEFVFGEKLLVCPIIEPNAKGRRMYIPKGKWYDFWDDKIIEGGKEKWVDADIDSMPIFIKEGAIIPKFPIQQYVGEKEIDELTLDVYYKKGKEKSELYEDSSDGYEYKTGKFSLRHFNLIGKSNELIIQQYKSGKFITSYKTFKIKLHGMPFKVARIQFDKEEVEFEDVKVNGDNTVIVSKEFTELHILGSK
jgi:alpha-glucosidase